MNETWATSSYCSGQTTCVEARTQWRTSSHSNADGNCVETRAAWATSSYCTGSANCVEVGKDQGEQVVQVRDTKDRDRGTLTFGAAAWQAFTRL